MSDTEVLEAPVSSEATPAEPTVDNSDQAALGFDLPAADATPQYVEDVEPEVAAEESPAEETAAEVAEAAEPAGLDESLLSLAERHGFSKEQAELFGSPESLQLALMALDRQAAAWGEAQFGQEHVEQPQEQQKPDAAQPAQQTQQQSQQQAAALEKFKLEANAEDWDENTLKAFTGLNDHYHDVISKQQQEMLQMRDLLLNTHDFVSQITGQSQQAEAVQIERDLDSFFGSLGDEFAEVYGKGPIKALKLDSTEVKNRQEVFKKMRALELSDQHQGRPPMERTEMLKRVNAFLHPDLLKNTARKELAQKVQERQKQTLARPAGKQGKPQTDDEAALRYLRENAPRLGH